MATDITYASKPWLKSYEKGVPESIKYEELTMPDFLERSVKDFPDETAMVFVGYKLTYRQFKDQVDRFATCLTDSPA
jgi:long-chain acyl-CoA synthetase